MVLISHQMTGYTSASLTLPHHHIFCPCFLLRSQRQEDRNVQNICPTSVKVDCAALGHMTLSKQTLRAANKWMISKLARVFTATDKPAFQVRHQNPKLRKRSSSLKCEIIIFLLLLSHVGSYSVVRHTLVQSQRWLSNLLSVH